MNRKTLQHRFHVSNRAAILTALILVFTSFTGFSSKQSFDQQPVDNSKVSVTQSGENTNDRISKSRKMNLSLLLFGRG